MNVKEALRQARESHTNLAMFVALQSLAESGCFCGSRPYEALSKIISICQREAQTELVRHDKAETFLKKNARR